jgi:hypothetical protein
MTFNRIIQQPEVVQRLEGSFPSYLQEDQNIVFQIIPAASSDSLRPTDDDIGVVYVNAKRIYIPYRFYSPEPDRSDMLNLSNQQLTILSCIYSRHDNGHIRQKYADYLITPVLNG